MVLTYRKASKSDADLLINIYNLSFYEDYINYGECPAYGKTKEQMELSILEFSKYIILKDDIPVGAISFKNKGNGNYYLGCLCIIPTYQRMGIGSNALQYMLSICPEWKQITLVTPSDKEQNIKFYTEKCGFNIIGKEMDGNVEIAKFILER
ncbi:MAG: GNAT family N-acetyltransferase [Clostridiales bacterium]|nr:GNAT family N-acetyltransferase [Clostridiales bacterium]